MFDEPPTVLVEMDSDLSHDPRALPVLLATVDEGAALAIVLDTSLAVASRTGRSTGGRYLASATATPTDFFASTSPTPPRASAPMTPNVFGQLDLDAGSAEGYAFQIEMTYRICRGGGRVVELPISFTEPTRGRSKMSLPIVLEAFVLVTRWASSSGCAASAGPST